MAKSQLCWKCANATDCKKCPFVARLSKFYIRHKGQAVIIRDLSRYYIKGTKLDNKGNIISCPLFVLDKLDHRTKTEKLNDFANENNLSVNGVFIQKYEVLNKFKKEMQAMSEEEKERRQNEFKERVKAKYEQLEKIEKGKAEDKEQKQQTEKTGKSKTEKKGLKQNVTKKIKPLSKNAKKRIISELQIKLQEKDFDKSKILIANIKDIELQTYCQDLYLFEKIKQLAKENKFENAFNILENISKEDIKENAISNICDKFLYQIRDFGEKYLTVCTIENVKVRQRLIFEIIKDKLERELLLYGWMELKEAITLINEFALKEHKSELLQMAYKYNGEYIKKQEEKRIEHEKRSQARKEYLAKKKQQNNT